MFINNSKFWVREKGEKDKLTNVILLNIITVTVIIIVIILEKFNKPHHHHHSISLHSH